MKTNAHFRQNYLQKCRGQKKEMKKKEIYDDGKKKTKNTQTS